MSAPLATGNPVTDELISGAYPATPEVGDQRPPSGLYSHQPTSIVDIKALEDVIRETIETAVELCDGSIPKAAVALDVSPSTLYRRLRTWQEEDAQRKAKSEEAAA